MKAKADKSRVLSENLFPVVGIGASAGGLKAFKQFLQAIPPKSGIAYVLVQHLDPNHESILSSLLQRVTTIPVVEITDDIRVEPDHIYIIPSNKSLVANDGVLELTTRPQKNKTAPHLPIDRFFISLAQIHGAHAIGIVLSGNGTDGTLGLKAIKEAGGITFAQEETSAANSQMPLSAKATGIVDFVMHAEEMPGKLVEIKQALNKLDKEAIEFAPDKEDIYKEILSLLKARKGTDFTHYKQSTIRRRIGRRMALRNTTDPEPYLNYLTAEQPEQDALYQDLLIPVTAFWRDGKIFDKLCKEILPQMLKNKAPEEPMRVWVAGCSTGQEAYSIAICLKELIGTSNTIFQIFATDISEPAIKTARKGIYSEGEMEGLSKKQLENFFIKKDKTYQVIKELRDQCVFAVHDLLRDPPFGKLDLVSCRNVLIYMEPYLQKRALTTFHYGLNPKGLLLLGKSESVGTAPHLFAVAHKNEKVFSRKQVTAQFHHEATTLIKPSIFSVETPLPVAETDFQKAADDVVLNRYMPPGVVVNTAFDIVQFRGSTAQYLEVPSGKPSYNLLKMAKNGLAFELRTLLQKTKKQETSVTKEHIPLQVGGVTHNISLESIPLPNGLEAHYLILFHDHGPMKVSALNGKGATRLRKDKNEKQIIELENELAYNREDMRSITGEQEAVNQELQRINEELLSANEELQSLNEELETSKEELQSSNEELSSLNEHINVARQYAESIVDTMREPVIILTKDLRVKSANNAFYTNFQVAQEEAEGRVIFDLANREWDIPALHTLLEDIVPLKTNITGYEMQHHFPTIGHKVLLLNALAMPQRKDEEQLILLAIENITEQADKLQKKKLLLTRFQNLVKQAPVAMCILKGKEHVVELANEYYLKVMGTDEKIVGAPFFETHIEWKNEGMQELLDVAYKEGTPFYAYEQVIAHTRKDVKEQRYFNLLCQPMRELEQKITGIIMVLSDVTEQVVARKRMEEQAAMVKNLLMTAPGFVCTLTGPEHRYKLVNKRYQDLFGKRNIVGKPILEALPELGGQGIDKLLDAVYETGEPYLGIDIPMTLARDEHEEPEVRYFNFSYHPIYNDNHEINAILVFGYEVTEQVNAKNRIIEIQQLHAQELGGQVLQRTNELSKANGLLLLKNNELIQINQELEAFAYVSSHDLQEPLRKIQTYASLLLQTDHGSLSEKGKSYFHSIQAAAARMRTLITDLLSYSRTELSNRVFEPTDLNVLVKQVLTEMAELIFEKKAVVECDVLCTVPVNPSQLQQVFTNLLGNAIKFSLPGIDPFISIKSKTLTRNQVLEEVAEASPGSLSPQWEYCRLSISDNGIGIDLQYKDKIFEVFQRLHSKESYKGTGIGLAIVKKIVSHHKGFIRLESEVGKGTTFHIYLPMGGESRNS